MSEFFYEVEGIIAADHRICGNFFRRCFGSDGEFSSSAEVCQTTPVPCTAYSIMRIMDHTEGRSGR